MAHAARASASSFLGRGAEVLEVSGLLDDARLVTLTGPPGIGKSRLGVEVAARYTVSRSIGSGLVELAAIRDPALLPAALASALSVQEIAGESVADTVVARVGERRLLLILDNCEHLVDACATLVGSLLGACPRISILATSREPLRTAAELVWEVPPLSLPDEGEPVQTERLIDFEAVRLFVERAGAVEPGLVLNDYTAPSVLEICRRLDGIPLPIELAAARVESLTTAEIARRLDDRFDLLTDRTRGSLGRERALEMAIDWSYELLSRPERALLRHLSVFAGGFDPESAAAVCVGDELATLDVAELLDGLVSKSLVAHTPQSRRLRLLETIRAYAGERLEQAAEARTAREAHARFYTELAMAAEPALTGPAQQRWFERLEPERANLRSALDWSVGHGRSDWALGLSGALVFFWQVRGHFSEGREFLAAALAAGDGAPRDLIARALWGEGFLVLMSGDVRAAIARFEQCVALFDELDDDSGSARALLMLGHCRQLRADLTGLALIDESVYLARKAADTWCLATGLGISGFACCYRDRPAAARPVFEECLAVARAAGDRHGVRMGLLGLGLVALCEGDHRSAEPLLEECAALAAAMGELYAKASALCHLGEAAFIRGDYARARELLDETLLLSDMGGPTVPALVLSASAARAVGDREAARARSEEALRLARTNASNLACALQGLGELEAEEQHVDVARRLFEEALELAQSTHDRLATARALLSLGELAQRGGDLRRATAFDKDALRLHGEIGNLPGIAASLEAVAGLAADVGRWRHAARLLGAAETTRRERDIAPPPWELARRERDLARVRKGLGAPDFVRALAQGAGLSSAAAVLHALEDTRASKLKPRGWSTLTEGEQQVAALVAQGLTNPEIAACLLISRSTVKARLADIFAKLGVSRRSEVIRFFSDQQDQR